MEAYQRLSNPLIPIRTTRTVPQSPNPTSLVSLSTTYFVPQLKANDEEGTGADISNWRAPMVSGLIFFFWQYMRCPIFCEWNALVGMEGCDWRLAFRRYIIWQLISAVRIMLNSLET